MKALLPFLVTALVLLTGCELMPRNTLKDCRTQCADAKSPAACLDFCDCIHRNCRPLTDCLAEHEKATATAGR